MLILSRLKWHVKLRKMEIFHTSSFACIEGSRDGKSAHDICGVYEEGIIAERTYLVGMPSSKMEIFTPTPHLVLEVLLSSMKSN